MGPVGLCGPFPTRAAPDPMLYFAIAGSFQRRGGTIVEVLRRAWGRLLGKQSLIFYPLALGVVDTIAFLAIYVANGDPLSWSQFFAADFNRSQYVYDHFLDSFSLTPALGVAVFVGLVICVLTAMIRAPFFRAIAGPGYPLAPGGWAEAGRLSLFYLFSNVVLWIGPLATLASSMLIQLVWGVMLVVAMLIVFADYVIVFEGVGFVTALRRSLRLVSRRWLAVVLIFIILQLVYFGLFSLYDRYYSTARGVFVLLPVSHILVQALLLLFVDMLLIYLYEDTRRRFGA